MAFDQFGNFLGQSIIYGGVVGQLHIDVQALAQCFENLFQRRDRFAAEGDIEVAARIHFLQLLQGEIMHIALLGGGAVDRLVVDDYHLPIGSQLGIQLYGIGSLAQR